MSTTTYIATTATATSTSQKHCLINLKKDKDEKKICGHDRHLIKKK